MHFINRQIVLHCLQIAVLFMASINNSYAFHQDIEVRGTGTKIQAGFCLQSGTGCDIAGVEHLGLPPNTLPTDFETGKDIYVSAFTHFVFSGQHSTADPGFQATPGALRSNELISYKALGVLDFWNPSSGAWGATPDNVQIRLAGGLYSQTVADQSCGLFWCPPKVTLKDSFTIFNSKGVTGASSLIVGQATANGSFHSHLDWFLETSHGRANGGPDGAYLVEMSLFSNQRTELSDSFFILFNNNLTKDQFQLAVSSRVFDPTFIETPIAVPVPAALVMMLSSLGLLVGGRLCRKQKALA